MLNGFIDVGIACPPKMHVIGQLGLHCQGHRRRGSGLTVNGKRGRNTCGQQQIVQRRKSTTHKSFSRFVVQVHIVPENIAIMSVEIAITIDCCI